MKGWPAHYYAVIFSAQHSAQAGAEYADTSARLMQLAETQDGFLGLESASNEAGFGITVSYWRDEAAISQWRENAEHQLAQSRGKSEWYADYSIRICKVERAYERRLNSGD